MQPHYGGWANYGGKISQAARALDFNPKLKTAIVRRSPNDEAIS
jgi:hypothetical protein